MIKYDQLIEFIFTIIGRCWKIGLLFSREFLFCDQDLKNIKDYTTSDVLIIRPVTFSAILCFHTYLTHFSDPIQEFV